ncbi:MAG: FeoA family protein [candidate division WOR-3 bacterium]
MPLTQLESGETGIVTEIKGGPGLIRRLDALGISPGMKIVKVSAMILHGPVIVRIKNTELALGFGMANKILVKKDGYYED